jgi:cytochrome c
MIGSDGHHRNDAAVWGELGAILLGMLTKAGARADTRYCEFMPASVYLVPLRLNDQTDLRISVEDDPKSLVILDDFKPGTPGTRPEVYVMGCRNPFRISLEAKTGYLYWGDVGPDAGGPRDGRGPAGFDEINQARSAGNFGWPYFVADNKPYNAYDFATKISGPLFDPVKPSNHSIYNTGLRELPPAQPAFIAYPYGPSTKFPVVNAGGGRTAMAGPVYYFDPNLKSDRKLPPQYDHTLFIYEWSRNWVITVKLNANDHIEKMERFCPNMTFKRPIDMELGPDGCLYIIENGTAWSNNTDTQIIRIEYVGG